MWLKITRCMCSRAKKERMVSYSTLLSFAVIISPKWCAHTGLQRSKVFFPFFPSFITVWSTVFPEWQWGQGLLTAALVEHTEHTMLLWRGSLGLFCFLTVESWQGWVPRAVALMRSNQIAFVFAFMCTSSTQSEPFFIWRAWNIFDENKGTWAQLWVGHTPQPCLLLAWTVSYFYECYKLLTVSVMTAQVRLILSNPLTDSMRLLTERSIKFVESFPTVVY